MDKQDDNEYRNVCYCPPGQCVCLVIPGQVKRVERDDFWAGPGFNRKNDESTT